MAITWDTQIENVDVVNGTAAVTFTREDSETPANNWVHTYPAAIISDSGYRSALLDQVWAEWQAELADRTAIATFLSNLEQTANTNLMAREE